MFHIIQEEKKLFHMKYKIYELIKKKLVVVLERSKKLTL